MRTHHTSNQQATSPPVYAPLPPVIPPGPAVTSRSGHGRRGFSKKELEEMVKWAVTLNPWGAPHRQKGELWKQVLTNLQADGLCKDGKWESVRNRVNDLVNDHEVRASTTCERELVAYITCPDGKVQGSARRRYADRSGSIAFTGV